MGAIHDMDNTDKNRTRTIKEWAIEAGLNPDTARRVVSRNADKTLGQKSILTADEWEIWKPGKSGTKTMPDKQETAKRVTTTPVVRKDVPPEPKHEPKTWWKEINWPSLATVRRFLLDLLLISIVVGHAGLIWYDCAAMWAEPGQIGGGLAFGIILAAVMLATDSSKNITSQWALILALLVDVGAYWVHFPTFQTYSVPDAITSVLCVFLCTMSFGALFLYRHLKNN